MPAWANSTGNPTLKKPITKKKKTGGMAQVVGPEFKPQYCEKKKKSLEW
jgi:hypothetical protein